MRRMSPIMKINNNKIYNNRKIINFVKKNFYQN